MTTVSPTPHPRRGTRFLSALLVAVGLVAAACSSGEDPANQTANTASDETLEGADTGATSAEADADIGDSSAGDDTSLW